MLLYIQGTRSIIPINYEASNIHTDLQVFDYSSDTRSDIIGTLSPVKQSVSCSSWLRNLHAPGGCQLVDYPLSESDSELSDQSYSATSPVNLVRDTASAAMGTKQTSKCCSSTAAGEGRHYVSDARHNDDTSGGIVVYSKNHGHGKNRKLPCYFCEMFHYQMPRHLKRKHGDESAVAQVICLAPGRKRNTEMQKLVHQGMFKYNSQVLKNESGVLLVARAPSTKRKATEFLPCSFCLQFFVFRELYRHCQTCTFRPGGEAPKKGFAAAGRALLAGSVCDGINISPEMKEHVISRMRIDRIRRTAVSDHLIVQLGTMLLQKLGYKRATDISARMRELARLLSQLRVARGDCRLTLTDAISGNEFDKVVDAIKVIGGFSSTDNGRRVFKTPAFVIKVAGSLLKCAQLKRGAALRVCDNVSLKDADEFLVLHKSEFTDRLVSAAHATYRIRGNTLAEYPAEDDLQLLKEYLQARMKRLSAEVQEHPDDDKWRELAELTLTRILVFNARRGAEVAELTVANFQKTNSHVDPVISCELTDVEKQMLNRFVYMCTFFLQRNSVHGVILSDVYVGLISFICLLSVKWTATKGFDIDPSNYCC